MKRIMSIITVLLMAGSLAFAQQSGRERREAAEKKAAQERSRSMGGFRSGNEVKDDKDQVPKGTNAAGQQKTDQQPAIDSERSNQPTPEENLGSKADNGSNSDNSNGNNTNSGGGSADANSGNSGGNSGSEKENRSNTPEVIQRTTSESGSPSVLSEDNGRGRDGTNSVQRATYNMAGAEVPANMNLSQKNRSERNMNTGARIRKQEEQPQKAVSKQTQRENKQQVDAQQRSDEQARSKSDEKKKNKSQKKNRRNKDRDSG